MQCAVDVARAALALGPLELKFQCVVCGHTHRFDSDDHDKLFPFDIEHWDNMPPRVSACVATRFRDGMRWAYGEFKGIQEGLRAIYRFMDRIEGVGPRGEPVQPLLPRDVPNGSLHVADQFRAYLHVGPWEMYTDVLHPTEPDCLAYTIKQVCCDYDRRQYRLHPALILLIPPMCAYREIAGAMCGVIASARWRPGFDSLVQRVQSSLEPSVADALHQLKSQLYADLEEAARHGYQQYDVFCAECYQADCPHAQQA